LALREVFKGAMSLWSGHRLKLCRSAVHLSSRFFAARGSSGRGVSRIAVVDLSALGSPSSIAARRSAAESLSAAFADTGFAVIVGHGVSMCTVATLRTAALRFFDLGLEVKRAVNEGFVAGYGKSPYCHMEENGAQLLGDFSKPADVVESLYYVGLGKQEVAETLPRTPPALKPAILAHEREMAMLRGKLRAACELALDLEPGFLTARCDSGNESVRLAHYPELTAPPLDGQLRYGAHVDSYGLTLLWLDPLLPGGLQVQIGGEWADVPFVEDGLVVNVGACLSRWTNSLWRASVHRVLLRPGRRLSIVAGAVRPCDDTVIEALGPHATAEPRLPPVVMRDFVAERMAMHRPSYLAEKGLAAEEAAGLSREIRSYER